jgi:prolyl-tRNA synthetase
MIETKDTTELFERLEKELADEGQLVGRLEKELADESLHLAELKKAVTFEPSVKPRRVGRLVMAVVAGFLVAAAGIGVGMLIQYQDTQSARDQVTQLQGDVAHMNAVNLYNMATRATRAAELRAIYQMKALQVAPAPSAIFNMPTATERAAELQADHLQRLQWAASQQTG